MKSLLEIQQEIRKLETDISSVAVRTREISNELERLRNSGKDTGLDYSIIETLARNIPFENHRIKRIQDQKLIHVYLETLISIVLLDHDPESTVKRFVFIEWIRKEANSDWKLEELYNDCRKASGSMYTELSEVLPDTLRDCFMVDAIITASIAGVMNQEIQEYIVNISAILGLSKNKIYKLALVSRMAITLNPGAFTRESLLDIIDMAPLFRYYIDYGLTEECKKRVRIIVVSVEDRYYVIRNFKWKVKDLQSVKAGDILAEYSYVNKNTLLEKKSPGRGVIYQFRHNNTFYGILSHESDNKDNIKDWVRAGAASPDNSVPVSRHV